MIKPSVGRVIHFYPGVGFSGARPESGAPLPALISLVWSDALINIGGFDANGAPFSQTSVPLVQDGEPKPAGFYASWMPYQIAQAQKDTPLAIEVNGEQSIEAEIQAKGLTAPRVTPDDLEANIVSEHYFTAQDGRNGAIIGGVYAGREKPQMGELDLLPLDFLTFCVLVLRNGFTVTGESACVSSENFDAELGRKIARQNAISKVWPLMGYALRESLAG